jgi:antitoxin ParD1/3/4
VNVTLTQELEGIVKERMASGLYNSPAEVLREALRLIAERDWLLEAQRELLRQDVQAGLDQLDRGEFATPTVAQIKERVAARVRREQ